MRGLPAVEEAELDVSGAPTRYLTAGRGRPMVLLHGLGGSRADWRSMLPFLARDHCIYAPDLPGFGGTGAPPDCSSAFYEAFALAFLDALGLTEPVVVGNSLGGLVSLRLALHAPDRVRALGLIASAGLGRQVSPALRQLTLPAVGDAMIRWGRTRIGAAQRARGRVPMLFANPGRVPPGWLVEQYRLARLPGFLDTTLAVLRAQVDWRGQREILTEDLPRLSVPTVVVWGRHDLVIPLDHARTAARLVPRARLHVVRAGHVPHIEQPEVVGRALSSVL